ncbi:N-acetylmuramoyl-L-alanine amidase AmiD precursor [Sphingobacterium spiritivorum]|uniref:N-acetylmuramoyl-L-alanine amidase n=1 Tax=Sphingobacterium spiritivorum TaxID=258 RepID=A0A380CB58_SPHSI|nr:N-acetylmuramoyl-L-alanine amidase [Sphingobacterium spiritivorum]SUJ15812.1 N-acetylmuramoyl-L-alanine amidase AmiD precursor [Sphingobacterium spiritivorum]
MKAGIQAVFGVLVVVIGFSACKTNQYAKTNKQYHNQVKEIASTLTAELPQPSGAKETADSAIPEVKAVDKVADLQQKGMRKDLDWVGAIHFDIRKPNYVIIHHTAQDSLKQTLRTFTLEHTKVSAHYLIGKKGEVYQLLNDYLRGWHAGASKWGSVTDMNSVSLGIELDNNGREPFSDVQINALLTLLDTLKTNYDIPTANFIGHGDIAPTRKNDPSIFFPWKKLAERGFGLWYDERTLMTPPENFNPVDALKIIGYDTRNLSAAIVAFKRKFIVNDLRPELTLYDKSVLYNLYLKY